MNQEIFTLLAILLVAIMAGSLYAGQKTTEGFSSELHVENTDWKKYVGMWSPKQDHSQYTLKSNPLYTSQGSPNPLEAKAQKLGGEQGANVDGTAKSEKALSMFAFNHSDPKCCYGPNGGYSTSSGCVCVTPEQQKFLAQAGNNRQAGYLGI